MKISKRRKLDILFIFVIFLIIELASFILYETTVLASINTERMIEEQVEEGYKILSEEEKEVLYHINEYRKENGLKELQPFSTLQYASKIKAQDLVNYNYFSHTSDRLGTPFEMLEDLQIDYQIAGENLAGNTTPKKAVEAWIASPSHRDNILEEEYEYTGICVIESQIYGKIFVQLFIGTN